LELLVDADGLGGVQRPVRTHRHVVQLAQRGMSGAGVVPGVGALLGDVAEALVGDDLPVRLQLVQQSTQSGGHDAPTDQNDIDGFGHPTSLAVGAGRPFPAAPSGMTAPSSGTGRTPPAPGRAGPHPIRRQTDAGVRRRVSSSAICTAFSAAPLRRLSLLMNSTRPLPSGADWSARMRPTKLGSLPAACSGVGTSSTTTPGAEASTSYARSGVMSFVNSAWIDSE